MFIFQFLNDKIHSYVVFDIIVHFIIQKLKNKHTFLKNIQTEKAEEPLILTEQDETKTRNFAPESNKDNIVSLFVVKKNCLIRTVLIFLLPAGRTFQPNDDNISSFSILITSSSFFFSQRHGKMSNTKKITHK